ncbi:hypothetical protein N9W41_01305, partial [bacterium]|nr:hypothetical protein [bacterium]
MAPIGSKAARTVQAQRALNYMSQEDVELTASIYALYKMKNAKGKTKSRLDLHENLMEGLPEELQDKWYKFANYKGTRYGETLGDPEDRKQIFNHIEKIKKEKGIDLSRWGVLYAMDKENRVNWFVLKFDKRNKKSIYRNKKDILEYHIENVWKGAGGSKGTALNDEFNMSLGTYVKSKDNQDSPFSQAVLDFKDKPTLGKAKKFITPYRDEVKAFLQRSDGEEVYLAPVLSSTPREVVPTQYIAESLADISDAKVLSGSYVSQGSSPQKSMPTARARLANVTNAVTVDAKKVQGRHIVIIDDVKTTGATVEELKRAYFFAGAKSVKVFTLGNTANTGH